MCQRVKNYSLRFATYQDIIVEIPSTFPRQLTITLDASVNWIHNPPLDYEKNRVPTAISKSASFAPVLGETSFTAFYRTCQSLAGRIVEVMELTTPPSDGTKSGKMPDVPNGSGKLKHGMDLINDQEAERIFLIGAYYQRTGKVASAEYYFGALRRRWPQSKWAAQAENPARFSRKD